MDKGRNPKRSQRPQKKIEAMENSQRLERLGLAPMDKRTDDLFQEYIDHVRLHASANTVKRYLAVLNTFLEFLKMFHLHLKFLSQIKPDHIESYQRQRLESVELKIAADGDKLGNHKNKRLPLPQTVNYEIGVLRSAFIWARDRELIAFVPTRKVKPLRIKPKRQARILTPEECRTFLRAAQHLAREDKRFGAYPYVFRFLLNTGLRSGELCNLTWNDLNLETGLIKIQPKEGWTPKSYSREFFLNQSCIDLLKSLDRSEGYIFRNEVGHQLAPDDVRRALIKIAKVAGIEGLTRVHDLRHTFNSLMQMNGVDAPTMSRILGHKDLATTMIYTHQTQEHLKKSIEKVGI